MTPDLKSQIDDVNNQIAALKAKKKTKEDGVIAIKGRSSSQGSKVYNRKLGRRRAEAVAVHVDTGWAGKVKISSVGEKRATEDVDVEDTGSMMSRGGEVRKGHYINFLKAMDSLTGKSWSIE